MTGDDVQALEHNAAAIPNEDLDKEIAFARGALDPGWDNTVVWLSELLKRKAAVA